MNDRPGYTPSFEAQVLAELATLKARFDGVDQALANIPGLVAANIRQETINQEVEELKKQVGVLEKSALLVRGGMKTFIAVGSVVTFVVTALYQLMGIENF